ncbi:hypothetical protein ACF082_34040 [Streptomyces lydicus]|uniref:hypothetical protein n=1 Tax=Streptomyces lydicus TaxID=47763 RepID=UPI00370024DB
MATDPTSYDTTERIRIFCLERIAEQARIPFEAPELPPWGLRPTVSPRMADHITDHLQDEAELTAAYDQHEYAGD